MIAGHSPEEQGPLSRGFYFAPTAKTRADENAAWGGNGRTASEQELREANLAVARLAGTMVDTPEGSILAVQPAPTGAEVASANQPAGEAVDRAR